MEGSAPVAGLRPQDARAPAERKAVGFTVGEPAPEPEQQPPEPEPAADGGAEQGGGEEYDEDEDWDYDEEYWSDDELDEGRGGGLRARAKLPGVLTKKKEKKRQKAQMAAAGVEWKSNDSTKVCQLCEKKFSLKVRRHHCRRCGGIFCAACSPKSWARGGDVQEPLQRACDRCLAEVQVEPMFAWLSRHQAVPRSIAEAHSAWEKVRQFSTNQKMQDWLLSPFTHICEGGRLVAKPDDLDETSLQIYECLPPGAEQLPDATLMVWARALLFLDQRRGREQELLTLPELHERAVPDIVPEVVFWQRYFGQIYRTIQHAMSKARRPNGGMRAADAAAIANAVRGAAMEGPAEALSHLLQRVLRQFGPQGCRVAANSLQEREGRLTVLHWVAMAGDVSKCEVLLRGGAAPGATSACGMTPLFGAAAWGRLPAAELLLRAKAAPDSPAHNGMTALQVAELRGHRAIADLLRASGAAPAAAEQGSVALSAELEQALAAAAGGDGLKLPEGEPPE